MTITTRLSRSLNLVKAFEAFHARAAPRSEGGLVIGYGHTASAREGAVVTRAEAEDLLLYDLGEIGKLLDAWVYAPMHDNQRQALIAFGFNIGAENLHASSALRRLNAGDYMGCAREIERWRMAELAGRGQVVDALVRRRAAEKALFLTPINGFLKTESSRLRPKFDGARTPPVPAAGPSETTSAAVAAAHAVSARLRALLPDPEPQGQPPASPSEPAEAGPAQPDHDATPTLPPVVHANIPKMSAVDVPDRDPAERQTDVAQAGPAEVDLPEANLSEASISEVDLPEASIPDNSAREADLSARNPLEAAPGVVAEGLGMEAAVEARPAWPLDETAPPPPPPPFVPAAARSGPVLVSTNDVHSDSSGGPEAPFRQPPDEAAAPLLESQVADAPKAPALRERLARVSAIVLKRGHVFLGLLGVLLFALSIMFILTGAPNMANLAIGLVGVLCMTPAAYTLLGARAR